MKISRCMNPYGHRVNGDERKKIFQNKQCKLQLQNKKTLKMCIFMLNYKIKEHYVTADQMSDDYNFHTGF